MSKDCKNTLISQMEMSRCKQNGGGGGVIVVLYGTTVITLLSYR